MLTTSTQQAPDAPARTAALADRVMRAASGAFEAFTLYLGDQLGFYDVLAAEGPLTSAQLAQRTGTDERYVREWLEQQAVVGFVAVHNPDDSPDRRVFYLPDGHADVLVNRESLDFLAPLPQLVAGAVTPLQDLLKAFRTGDGVAYERYGRDLREGQARMNRAAFLYQLGPEWLPAIPGLRQRLERASPPARVADLGCGAGWSSIGVAKTYPHVRVDGFDLDEASVALAETNAIEAGVADRVTVSVRDAADPELAGRYDLVMALECVHDMAHPVAALRTMRRLARQDGEVLVVDERVADAFDPGAGGMEWLMYGFSVLHCLPVGRTDEHSACTGTVMRAGTLRGYALQAGFTRVEVLPVEHPLFRFYRLKAD